jgi:hypothetical protein
MKMPLKVRQRNSPILPAPRGGRKDGTVTRRHAGSRAHAGGIGPGTLPPPACAAVRRLGPLFCRAAEPEVLRTSSPGRPEELRHPPSWPPAWITCSRKVGLTCAPVDRTIKPASPFYSYLHLHPVSDLVPGPGSVGGRIGRAPDSGLLRSGRTILSSRNCQIIFPSQATNRPRVRIYLYGTDQDC